MHITPSKDPMGQAICDYYKHGKADRLKVLSSKFDDDELPVPHLFRTLKEMNTLEREALKRARGRILDVGAGSGCHSLVLQDRGYEVVAIDISSLSVEVAKARGVKQVQVADFMEDNIALSFDTIYMLMNGIGICGTMDRLPLFFQRLNLLLSPHGSCILDSSDLSYIYEEEESIIDLTGVEGYYGEIDFTMQYKDIKGNSFHWLYLDFDTLQAAASCAGFEVALLCQGDNNDFLVEIKRKGE